MNDLERPHPCGNVVRSANGAPEPWELLVCQLPAGHGGDIHCCGVHAWCWTTASKATFLRATPCRNYLGEPMGPNAEQRVRGLSECGPRHEAALALADTLLARLGHEEGTPAELDVCPLCGGCKDGGHSEDWGDGAGCPVLVYLDARGG